MAVLANAIFRARLNILLFYVKRDPVLFFKLSCSVTLPVSLSISETCKFSFRMNAHKLYMLLGIILSACL